LVLVLLDLVVEHPEIDNDKVLHLDVLGIQETLQLILILHQLLVLYKHLLNIVLRHWGLSSELLQRIHQLANLAAVLTWLVLNLALLEILLLLLRWPHQWLLSGLIFRCLTFNLLILFWYRFRLRLLNLCLCGWFILDLRLLIQKSFTLLWNGFTLLWNGFTLLVRYLRVDFIMALLLLSLVTNNGPWRNRRGYYLTTNLFQRQTRTTMFLRLLNEHFLLGSGLHLHFLNKLLTILIVSGHVLIITRHFNILMSR
jgi:hypothetical protein